LACNHIHNSSWSSTPSEGAERSGAFGLALIPSYANKLCIWLHSIYHMLKSQIEIYTTEVNRSLARALESHIRNQNNWKTWWRIPSAVVYEGKRIEESPDESIGSPDWVITQAKDSFFPKSLSDKLEYLKAAKHCK
jgi:hypothetical protein